MPQAPTIELATRYTPADVEPEIAARWNDAQAFHAEPTAASPASAGGPPVAPYCIVIPPPNVTAALHMGHALNNALQDVLIRWRRMRGGPTLWMPGTDHAGIATQTVVDKRLQQEGQPALKEYKQLEAEGQGGRDQFIEKVQAWKDEYEARITDQLKVMGCSCDWDRQRFTMDPVCAAAVREAFFRLFKDGLIYRGKRLVNWDPVTQTALADDEVEMQEVDGHFWYLRYPLIGPPLASGENFVTVATTRPETMLGDTAVAVNPKDPRAAELRGRKVLLPIVNREIPIIEDDYVVLPVAHGGDEKDPKAQFATGFLKVTPAHDPNDWDIGQRHDLAVINVMAPDGSISKDHGWPAEEWDPRKHPTNDAGGLLGMSREDAREAIVAFFKERQLLENVRDYQHSVGHSYRSHAPIEPYLSDQWYVKVTDDRLAGAALRSMAEDQRSPSGPQSSEPGGPPPRPTSDSEAGAAARLNEAGAGDRPAHWDSRLRFTPPRYAKTFQTWHENIRDWCISRQLWWGHRIPVWTRRMTRAELMSLIDDDPKAAVLIGESRSDLCTLAITDDKHVYAVGGYEDGCDEALAVMRDAVAEDEELTWTICLRKEATTVDDLGSTLEDYLEAKSFTQDPDVLDTWFSSALWPISTLGWPDPTAFPNDFPEGDAPLNTWNPSNTLCTAREIITLWVSRMVMFNIYFRGCLPFEDVFIHAMIQDGHGQKMSKSLGNGVDPVDIIHTHGADAMRFALAGMTTQTQDVRMPVDLICPHCEKEFEPKTSRTPAGHTVAAARQTCPHCGGKMASSYGVASGKAAPDGDTPPARNTSPKFDQGRNFANKLWNATRFMLGALSEAEEATAPAPPGYSLIDRWVLSRTARAIEAADAALAKYDFHNYAEGLLQFVWNDVCDWYIEGVKSVIRKPAGAKSRQVIATVLDVTLRLLHPVMPFVTEKLWEPLGQVAPKRGVRGLDPVEHDLLATAPWPTVDRAVIDLDAEQQFETLQTLVRMIRDVRKLTDVKKGEALEVSIKLPQELVAFAQPSVRLVEDVAGVKVVAMGPDVEKPENAAEISRPLAEVFLHQSVDTEADRQRLTKQRDELEKTVKTLEGRLNNKGYTDKAPAHLVQQTRDQLAMAERELAKVKEQLEALGE